jgi:hypothetical protein
MKNCIVTSVIPQIVFKFKPPVLMIFCFHFITKIRKQRLDAREEMTIAPNFYLSVCYAENFIYTCSTDWELHLGSNINT